MSLAKAVIVGVIVSDVEKRFTPNNNTAVTSFQISVQSPGKMSSPDPAMTFTMQVSCWRQLAEVAAEQLTKGETVMVEGKLMLQSYQTPDGVAKKSYEIEAVAVSKLPGLPIPLFVPAAGGASTTTTGAAAQPYATTPQYAPQPQYGYGQPQQQGPATQQVPVAAPYGHQPTIASQQPNSLMQSISAEEFMMTEDDIPF